VFSLTHFCRLLLPKHTFHIYCDHFSGNDRTSPKSWGIGIKVEDVAGNLQKVGQILGFVKQIFAGCVQFPLPLCLCQSKASVIYQSGNRKN